jgi:hypothetical protein
MDDGEIKIVKTRTSLAGRVDGLGNPPVQY